MIKRIFIYYVSAIVSILVAQHFIPNVAFNGTIIQLCLASAIFALLNILIKPILRALLFPLIFITFGLFTILINMVVLWILTALSLGLIINTTLAFIETTMLISIVHWTIFLILEKRK